MSDVGAEDKNEKRQEANENDHILLELKKLLKDEELNNIFDDIFCRLIEGLQKFSTELNVDYHIVVLNREKGVRYSIIEGKKPSIASKPIDFGIVGSLINNPRKKYQSIFVQFKFSLNAPTIVYSDADKILKKLEPNVIEKLIKEENAPIWDAKRKDFAIAASLIKDTNDNVIGACSIDFGAKSDAFPDFSFRESEIKEVFNVLYTLKVVFEKLMCMESSELLKKVIKLAKEGKHHGCDKQ